MLQKYSVIFLIILITLAALFWIDNLIKKKQATPSGPKWRIVTGLVELTIAIVSFIWLRSYPVSALLLVGTLILAIVGIGDVLIGLLNPTKGKAVKNI